MHRDRLRDHPLHQDVTRHPGLDLHPKGKSEGGDHHWIERLFPRCSWLDPNGKLVQRTRPEPYKDTTLDTLVIDLCPGKRHYGRALVPGVVPAEAGAILWENPLESRDRLCIHSAPRGGELYRGSVFVSCHSLPACAGLGIYYAENRQRVGLDIVPFRNGYTDHAWHFLESFLASCSLTTGQEGIWRQAEEARSGSSEVSGEPQKTSSADYG